MVCYRGGLCVGRLQGAWGKYPIGTGVGSPRDSGSVSGRSELMDIMDMNWDGISWMEGRMS